MPQSSTYEDFVLPLMAGLEAVLTKGRSPGTAMMGQRQAIMSGRQSEEDRIAKEAADAEERRRRAIEDKVSGFKIAEGEYNQLERQEKKNRQASHEKLLAEYTAKSKLVKTPEEKTKLLNDYSDLEEVKKIVDDAEAQRREIEKEERAAKRQDERDVRNFAQQKELKQMDITNKKAEKEGKIFNIPGTIQTEEVGLSDEEKKKLRAGMSEFKTFKKLITEYKSLIEKYGTMEVTDRAIAGKMDAYAKNLQLKIKNIGQLGVLSASDIPFIEKQIPQPGFFKTKEGMLGALNTTESATIEGVNNQLKVSGFALSQDKNETPSFASEAEAVASGVKGEVLINGRKAVIE